MSDRAQRLRDALDKDGFVVIKSILNDEQVTSLRSATAGVTTLGRAGEWPHVRTIGKQFPPWSAADATAHGIWGVQHLMKPSCPASASFTGLYFSDEILGICRDLMACRDEDLVMELFNMLVRPERDFELRWHRDDIDRDATPEQELERLNAPSWHVQYNLPLYEDDSIIVIPASHRRARTVVERSAGPYDELPGQMRVRLSPGDIVFYNNNIVHRGAYDSSKERVTLHGSVGHVKGSAHRSRNVLQHGVGDWVQDIDLSKLDERLLTRAQGMRDRLIKLGSESGDVGYSLQG